MFDVFFFVHFGFDLYINLRWVFLSFWIYIMRVQYAIPNISITSMVMLTGVGLLIYTTVSEYFVITGFFIRFGFV
jgi:hypothetical protein